MSQPFGQFRRNMHERRRLRRIVLLLSVSVAAIVLALPARAESYDFNDGDDEASALVLAGENTFTTAGGVTATVSGVISGGGALTKLGAGVLNLTGANTYSGGTLLSGGTLAISDDTALGTGSVIFTEGTLRFTGALAMTIANDMLNATYLDTAQHTTLLGVLAGTATINKLGGGTLTLANANTFSGGVILWDGKLYLQHDQALGTGTLTNAVLAGAIGYASGVTIANNILANNGTQLAVLSGTAIQAGTLTTGGSAHYLMKTGAGELVLMGKVNSSQQFIIREGVLTAGADNVLDENGTYEPEAGGTLRLWADQRVGTVTGAGTLDLGARKLELTSSGGSTFEGAMIGEEDANLVKGGTGWLTLKGDGTGYLGRMSLEGGVFTVDGNYAGTTVFVTGGALRGNGSLGDVFVDTGMLFASDGATLSMRDLSLTENALVTVALGAENATALFNVAGDLRLDGTLNITDIGGFGRGLYRIFTYGGALDDRGLEFGDIPEGYDVDNLTLQAGGGEVNVVADDPDYGPVVFWDGDNAANRDNRRVDGGDGRWRRGGSAFTDANGIANGPLDDPGFVIFSGQAGRVVVDTGFGEIHPDGMQFAVDGYLVTGELISWDDGDRIIRVGDGTTTGAGYTAEITNRIDGGGRLVKTDLGTLVLSGENAYRGGTLVQGGTLLVNGSILDVEVDVNGRLGGTGSIENDAYVRGTLAAGNSIGTLTIEGDLTMAAGSRLEVEVDALGNADRIDVTGTAHLEGGQVVTLASGGDYADATTYTILTAEGGVEGEFEGVSSNLAFLDAALSYGDKDVALTLTRNGVTYGNVGETRNQVATGEAVEGLGVGNGIYDRVLTLSAADARQAFDHLSGEVHASAKGVLAAQSRDLRDAMGDRITAAFDALGLPDDRQGSGIDFWSSASASGGTLKGDGNAADVSYSAGNLFVGGDATFNQNWLFGFAVGYGQSGLSIGARDSSATSTNLNVGLYGGGEVSDFTFKFGAGLTHHDIKTTRTAAFPGFEQKLTADYGGATAQVFGEIGHKFRFDSGLIVEPYANLALANVYTGAYAEEGGSAALSSAGGSFGSAVITAGIRGSQQFVIGDGTKALVTGAIGWTHATGGAPETRHAFAGGNDFTIAGTPVQGDSLILKAGLGVELSESADLSLGYSGQLGTQGQNHGLKASFSVKF